MVSTVNPDVVAVMDATGETAGSIVWWRLSGDTNMEDLEQVWGAAGLDPALLPKKVTPAEALARAMRGKQRQRTLARPLSGRRGWALVAETPHDEDLEYKTLCTGRVEKNGTLHLNHGADGVIRDEIRVAYEEALDTLTATDVSLWVSQRLVGRVKAVKLRDTGGIYFIPRGEMATFRGWMGALGEISDHQIFEVPALRSEEAVEAILDAVTREADQEIGTIEEDLDCEDLGKRALRTRERRCDGIRAKLKTYEQLLGRSMDAMQARLGGLEASIVEAVFLAEADDASDSAILV